MISIKLSKIVKGWKFVWKYLLVLGEMLIVISGCGFVMWFIKWEVDVFFFKEIGSEYFYNIVIVISLDLGEEFIIEYIKKYLEN